jgi:acetyl esterase/lipase
MSVAAAFLSPRVWSAGTSPAARALAWLGLIGASGLLLGAEVTRPTIPAGVRVVPDLVYREAGGRRLRLDVYTPDGPAPRLGRPALLAVHGGGWRGGGKGDFGRSLVPLVRRGYVVVAVEYRLSRPGEPSWPGNLEDVQEAARWVHRHAAEFGIDKSRIAALGASAGGHLALLLGSGEGAPLVSAVVDLYAPTDLEALSHAGTGADRSVSLLLGGAGSGTAERYAAASPIDQVRPGSPPVLILHGDNDSLIPLGQSRELAVALERAGVPHRLVVIKGARHGFGLAVGSRDLAPEIVGFLDGVWGANTDDRPSAAAGP